MSNDHEPQGTPPDGQRWPKRFDPNTGQPLPPEPTHQAGPGPGPGPGPQGPVQPGPVQPGPAQADHTQQIGYQPSALPQNPGNAQNPPYPPSGGPGWQPQAPQGQDPQQAGWGQPVSPIPPGRTDALGRPLAPHQGGGQPPQGPGYPSGSVSGNGGGGNGGKVAAVIALVVLLVGAVATGTFLLLNSRDDEPTPAAGRQGGGGTDTPTDDPSGSPTTAPSSPSSPTSSGSPSTEPTATSPSTSTSPSAPSTSTTPSAPGTSTTSKPKGTTYGAFDINEFGGDWIFQLGEVKLSAKGLRSVNYPNCDQISQGAQLKKLGCKFASEGIQENKKDHVRMTQFVMEFGSPKEAAAAKKKLTDADFNLEDGVRMYKDPNQGMWRMHDHDKFLVFTAGTTSEKIDERKLNRYIGYYGTDTTGALRFMFL